MEDSSTNSPPVLPPDSPGSSVSSRLQEEYNELLKYAVMLPNSEGQDQKEVSQHSEVGEPLAERVTQIQGERCETENGDRNQNATSAGKSSRKGKRSPRQQTLGESGVGSAEGCFVESVVTDMGCKLDGWLGELKGNILSTLRDSTVQAMECQRQQQDREMKQLQCERQQLQQEVNRMSDLVHTCEQSLFRKDTLVDNLTRSLAQQKEKVHLSQAFYNWRVSLVDAKREAFTSCLAQQHHHRQLSLRVFKAWFGAVQSRWRATVQRQCQAQAQSVCKQLSADYEAKVAQLNSTVDDLQSRIAYLQKERESYADNVKKAFMRGVCALNMEAMSAFTGEDTAAGGSVEGPDHNLNSHNDAAPAASWDVNLNSHHDQLAKDEGQVKSLPFDPVTSVITDLGPFQEVTPQPASFAGTTQNMTKAKGKSRSTKTSSAHTRASVPTGVIVQGHPLAPPMASVVVERHQPITKQTVGKATAVKYPKSSCQDMSRTARAQHQSYLPLAGQNTAPAIKLVD